MSLRTKAFLAAALVVVAGTTALFAVLQSLSKGGFEAVERDLVARDAARTRAVLSATERSLVQFASDYALWDDTYDFIAESTEASAPQDSQAGNDDSDPGHAAEPPSPSDYVADNFMESTFTHGDLQAIVIAANDGTILYRGSYEAGSPPVDSTPPRMTEFVAGLASDPAAAGAADVVRGIWVEDHDPQQTWLLAAAPVLHSDGSGPSNGFVAMARRLDPAHLSRIGESLSLDISLVPLEDLVARSETIEQLSGPPPAVAVDLTAPRADADSSRAAGYATVRTLNGTTMVLRISEPRTVQAQAEQQEWRTLVALALLGSALVVVVLFLVDRLVLRRLLTYGATVREITADRDFSRRIDVKGRDELGHLAADTNAMLDRIEAVTSQLDSARQAAEAASRSKSEFLANMSHELRTPMNAILGMTRLAKDTANPDDREDMLETVESAATSLLAIVDDVLDLSKVEAGKLTLNPAPFAVAEIVDEVTALLAPVAQRQGISLEAEVRGVRSYLLGDGHRIRQILVNLVGNAVKFTHRGGVTIKVTTVALEGDDALLCMEVADTGIGIPEERRRTIFDAFTQADPSTTRRYGGTGLGLTITARLVGLMGGSIDLASEEGKGSTFSVRIPLLLCDTAAVPPAHSPEQAPSGVASTPMHILVAEDNVVNQKVVARTLERMGHTCDIVADGAAALDAVRAGGVDAVLMDVQMPVLDGLEATRRIRSLEADRGGHVPIVALTAHAMAGDRERCLAAGVDAYTTKPFTMETLQAAIDTALRHPASLAMPPVDDTA